MRRVFSGKAVAATMSAGAARELHFPLTKPPLEITYLDSDPLEYALRIEARNFGLDDFQYMRELAFVRINDNPSVGEWRNLSAEERKFQWWGSDRQDFYSWFTYRLLGKREHLYHRGWN